MADSVTRLSDVVSPSLRRRRRPPHVRRSTSRRNGSGESGIDARTYSVWRRSYGSLWGRRLRQSAKRRRAHGIAESQLVAAGLSRGLAPNPTIDSRRPSAREALVRAVCGGRGTAIDWLRTKRSAPASKPAGETSRTLAALLVAPVGARGHTACRSIPSPPLSLLAPSSGRTRRRLRAGSSDAR
jgi:hypothetical protein